MVKKILLLSVCATVATGLLPAQKRFSSVRNEIKSPALSLPKASVIRASSVANYMYIDNDWRLLSTSTFKYDTKGYITEESAEEDGEIYTIFYQYDENGMVTEVLTTFTSDDLTSNFSKRTYKYDPVATDFCIERNGYDWSGSEWIPNYYCETNTITRNAEGNITENVKSLPLMSKMVPAYKIAWNYNAETGKAEEYLYYMNYRGDEVSWELNNNLSYREIEWDRTDGQMTGQIEQLISGPNRVKSYAIYYKDELDGYTFIEYSDSDSDDYVMKSTYSDPSVIGEIIKRETIDRFGSYSITRMEYFDGSGDPTAEPVYILTETVKFDEHGNMISDEFTESENGSETEVVSGVQVRYSYSKEGLVLEAIELDYDYDSKSYYPEFKSVYNDYIDVNGIAEASSDDVAYNISDSEITASAPSLSAIILYDMQGRKVLETKTSGYGRLDIGSLPEGIYILHLAGTGTTVKINL